jgi:hypothetical protein
MAKYLFVYHGGSMAATDEERQEAMARWGAWFGELGAAVVDAGAPIADRRNVGADDGANPATGYSVIEASSLDDAAAKAQGCPVIANGGSVEVGECIEIPM